MKIGVVLPFISPKARQQSDVIRLDMLLRSINAFVDPQLFGDFLLVASERSMSAIAPICEKWQHLNIQLINDTSLIPELRKYSCTPQATKRQLIKLAAAHQIKEDFYLSLDPDVLCLKPLGIDNLFTEQKALLQYEPDDIAALQWKAAAKVLNSRNFAQDDGFGTSSSPALFAKDVCLMVAEALTPKRKGAWVDTLCRLEQKWRLSYWTPARKTKAFWTATSLYYYVALEQGVLDEYHVTAGSEEAPHLLITHDGYPFKSWNVGKTFSLNNPGLFCVVGRSERISPKEVWQRVKNYIPDTPRR